MDVPLFHCRKRKGPVPTIASPASKREVLKSPDAVLDMIGIFARSNISSGDVVFVLIRRECADFTSTDAIDRV